MINILSIMNSCISSVQYYSSYEDKDNMILILELCDCHLEKIIIKNSGLDENQIFIILDKLNNAFEHMDFNNIIHLDIKPENILIEFKNNESEEKYINEEFKYYSYNNKGIMIYNYLVEVYSNKKIDFHHFEKMILKLVIMGF